MSPPIALALAALLAAPAPSPTAVPPTVEPSASQDEHLRIGTEAYRRQDYAAAVKAYDAALASGPLNIAWLNKGRALQRLGDCNGAADAYVRVLDAPAVTEPSPDTVRGALTRYREELAAECPGTLVVTCDPPDTRLSFVDPDAGLPDARAEPLPPLGCGTLVELPPGRYQIVARAHQQTERHRVTIVGVQIHTLAIQLTPLAEIEAAVDPWSVAGWSAIGISAVALAGGVFGSVQLAAKNEEMDNLARAPVVRRADLESAIDEAGTYEALQWSGYAVSAAALVAGLLLLDAADDGPAISPSADATRAGAILRVRF